MAGKLANVAPLPSDLDMARDGTRRKFCAWPGELGSSLVGQPADPDLLVAEPSPDGSNGNFSSRQVAGFSLTKSCGKQSDESAH